MKKRIFIFGYGSLINKESQEKTFLSNNRNTAILLDHQRLWNARIEEKGFTVLGIQKQENKRCNGILIEIKKEDLKKLDLRESHYSREIINPNDIVTNQDLSNSIIYTYIPLYEFNKLADNNFPIPKRYYNLCLDGCKKINDFFLDEFLKTTKNINENLIKEIIEN